MSIEHVDHIVDLRRHLVMVESSFPSEAEPMLRDVERSSNPWGKPQSERADWAARARASGSSSPATRRPSTCTGWVARPRSTSAPGAPPRPPRGCCRQAGVEFAILGPRESCTGDPARRIGNEYVFQAFAEQNVQTLNESGVTKIIANCPHCFNTLANEYPDFGGSYEVVHHTELLVAAGAARAGCSRPATTASASPTTTPATWPATTTCSTAPRDLVAAVGEPIEMKRSGKQTFCCGAGGAHMWMEERGKPINEARVREAAETGADTLAVACPYCTVMLDDGVQGAGEQLRVVDVATLLDESITCADAVARHPDPVPIARRPRDQLRGEPRRRGQRVGPGQLVAESPDQPGVERVARAGRVGHRRRRGRHRQLRAAGTDREASRARRA